MAHPLLKGFRHFLTAIAKITIFHFQFSKSSEFQRFCVVFFSMLLHRVSTLQMLILRFDFGFPNLAAELFRNIGPRFGRFAKALRKFENTQNRRKSPEPRPDKAKKLPRQIWKAKAKKTTIKRNIHFVLLKRQARPTINSLPFSPEIKNARSTKPKLVCEFEVSMRPQRHRQTDRL